MMWTTTGNLTNVQEQRQVRLRRRDAARGQAARQPDRRRQLLSLQEEHAGAAARPRSSSSSGSRRPQRAAQWGIDTGYVAVRAGRVGDAGDEASTSRTFRPAAVARDQLQFAVAELSTHDNQRVTKALNDGLQAALTGTKTPEQAMKDAQARSRRASLRPLAAKMTACGRRSTRDDGTALDDAHRHGHGWLLLLPAAALLALFTHYPAVATLWHSFCSTPKGARPARVRRRSTTTGSWSTTRSSGRR